MAIGGAVMNIASAVLAVILAVFFLSLGTAKILALAPMRKLAGSIDFSVTAYRGIGMLEAAAAIGLLVGFAVPLLGEIAGIGLLALLGGALVTHLRKGQGPREFAPAIACALLVVGYLALHYGATW
jgi:DoxX-like family